MFSTLRALALALMAASLPLGPTAAEPLRVATFNLFWLYDEAAPYRHHAEKRPESYARSLEILAEAIARLEADVVALQEVENAAVVADLTAALAARGQSFPHAYTSAGTAVRSGQNVALISRFPGALEPVRRYESLHEPYTTAKGEPRIATLPRFLRVDLEVWGRMVTLFVAHLRHQGGAERGESERLAQARLVRKIVRQPLERGRPDLILLGDLNDDRGSRTLRVLRGEEDGSVALHQTSQAPFLEVFAPERHQPGARGTPPPGQPDTAVGGPREIDSGEWAGADWERTNAEAWTFTFRGERAGERQQLDHILLSEALFACLRALEIVHVEASVSDHAAVVAELEPGCQD